MVKILTVGAAVPEEVPTTPRLERLLVRAARLGRVAGPLGDDIVSPRTLLLTIFLDDDPALVRIRRDVGSLDGAIDGLLAGLAVDRVALTAILAAPDEPEGDGVVRVPGGVRRWLDEARRMAFATQASDGAGLRHLLGVLLYRPEETAELLESLGIDRPVWSRAFLDWITEEHPGESAHWTALDREVFPRLVYDENVQFTVYRPRSVAPEVWHDLLVFAHLTERRPDAPDGEPDPLEEVDRQARRILGEDLPEHAALVQDSLRGVPREGEVTLHPVVDGIVFNPPQRTFLWTEPVHREGFRLKAGTHLDGTTARGTLVVRHGSILLAEVPLAFPVRVAAPTGPEPPAEAVHARPYHRIFASYAHADAGIVEEFERYVHATGDRYLRDQRDLRSGQRWDERLLAMIEEADVFQLFWSTNAMRSGPVEREWRHAHGLPGKPREFIRPVYWEDPLPRSPDGSRPAPELAARHFYKLPGSVATPRHGDDGAVTLGGVIDTPHPDEPGYLDRTGMVPIPQARPAPAKPIPKPDEPLDMADDDLDATMSTTFDPSPPRDRWESRTAPYPWIRPTFCAVCVVVALAVLLGLGLLDWIGAIWR